MIAFEIYLTLFTALLLPLLHYYFLMLIDQHVDPLLIKIHQLELKITALELKVDE